MHESSDRKSIVIDTNVFVSFLIPSKNRTTIAKLLEHVFDSYDLLFSDASFGELEEILLRSKFQKYFPREESARLISSIKFLSSFVEIKQTVTACRDPKDDKILDVAINGKAELIITGDDDLLELDPFQGIKILSPVAAYKYFGLE